MKRRVEFMRCLQMLVVVLALMVFPAASLYGQMGTMESPRTAYLQALADLRMARTLMDQEKRSEMRDEKKRTSEELDAAIQEVQGMVHDSGRSQPSAPLAKNDPDAVLRATLQLLNDAVQRVMFTKTPEALRDAQVRAVRHIDEARKSVNHALHPVVRR
jgi:hypothetical protein